MIKIINCTVLAFSIFTDDASTVLEKEHDDDEHGNDYPYPVGREKRSRNRHKKQLKVEVGMDCFSLKYTIT